MRRKLFLVLGVVVVLAACFVQEGRLFYICFPQLLSSREALNSRLKDPLQPGYLDYLLVQRYLEKGERPGLENLRDYKKGARQFRILNSASKLEIKSGKIVVNCGEDDLENCIVLYASHNRNFPQALKRQVEWLSKSDYKGHILYRIGGWPNVEEGDLALATIPYAFKLSFLREAKRLGYKRALWLDTAVLPLVSLNHLFSLIQEKGYLACGNTHTVGPFFNALSAHDLGVTVEESFHIPSCSGGIFGLDFSQENGSKFLDTWYKAAKLPHAFFSARQEQNVLSVLLYQAGMRDWISFEHVAEGEENIKPTSMFLLDRGFAHKKVESRH